MDSQHDTRCGLNHCRNWLASLSSCPKASYCSGKSRKSWRTGMMNDGRAHADQLGLCRNHGLCHLAARRPPGTSHWSGCGASAPSPIGMPALHNQKDGKRYMPLNHLSEQPTFDIYRFAVGRSGAGIRIWLCHHDAKCADHLGSAVRRLRQWCAGRHRPVHYQRGAQVGPPVRADHVAAAWL
jgi:hypothetical protein